jgi:hypothetical protein
MARYDTPEYGNALPDEPIESFRPKQIRHYTLKMEMAARKKSVDASAPPNPANYRLVYSLDVQIMDISKIADTEAYIEEYVLQTPIGAKLGVRARTPWDISVDGQQCYVVLDLSTAWLNWQFIGPGMTSKDPTKGRDFGLYWVTRFKDDAGSPMDPKIIKGSIDDAGCERIYFGVAQRQKYEHGCYMNFHTGFRQGGLVIPVIYDPDVPNTGAGIGAGGGGNGLFRPETILPDELVEEEFA